jgi:hypothetical protein
MHLSSCSTLVSCTVLGVPYCALKPAHGRHGRACDAEGGATRPPHRGKDASVAEELVDVSIQAGDGVRLLCGAEGARASCDATGGDLGDATLHGNVTPIESDVECLGFDDGLVEKRKEWGEG